MYSSYHSIFIVWLPLLKYDMSHVLDRSIDNIWLYLDMYVVHSTVEISE